MRLCHPTAGVEVTPEPVQVNGSLEYVVECSQCHAVLASAKDRDELFADL